MLRLFFKKLIFKDFFICCYFDKFFSTRAGVVSTFVGGSNLAFGWVDGLGSVARFGAVRGIAMNFNGDFFVSDNSNNLIRRVSSSGDR